MPTAHGSAPTISISDWNRPNGSPEAIGAPMGPKMPVMSLHPLAALRVGGEVLEEGHAIGRSKCRLVGFEYGRELLPALEHRVIIENEDHLAQRSRDAVPEGG